VNAPIEAILKNNKNKTSNKNATKGKKLLSVKNKIFQFFISIPSGFKVVMDKIIVK
jgi:hypothetical protein